MPRRPASSLGHASLRPPPRRFAQRREVPRKYTAAGRPSKIAVRLRSLLGHEQCRFGAEKALRQSFTQSAGVSLTSPWEHHAVHEDLSNAAHPNEGNIYIGKTTSRAVVKLFKEQFEKDFELFLKLRYTELVYDECMVLTFLSDKNEEILMHGDVGRVWELLAEALQNLVQKGMIEMEKFSSFNLPFYAPSVDEVKALINKTEMFRIQHIKLFESSWDPNDDLDDDEVMLDCARSAQSIAKSIRAVIEPLIIEHLGDSILDDLFSEYASIVAKHLKKGKARYRVMVISSKKVIH